ncbi:hypothetical protein [Grimontia sp. SpTr1]|uniref:hypothetical protein n=1 Tax=Grimontia sp. SpTr1 TaxID=2995319 RepID=UPI00248AB21D|nr:hypothetical protein [Grimontia sp. SpTr1]
MMFLSLAARQIVFVVLLFSSALSTAQAALLSYTPSQSAIPANTLRFYLYFSEPMARGQVQSHIRLEREDGSKVVKPFLNLYTELWDSEQRRVTLLFDPGRVKQSVGPNVHAGAPLVEGNQYRLVVSGSMKNAAGKTIGEDQIIEFDVIAPERQAIVPADWELTTPPANGLQPLVVTFDRIIDRYAAQRLIRLKGPDGETLRGKLVSEDRTWTLTPETAWHSGNYKLIVSPELEDISGNTIRSPFDAKSGTMGKATNIIEREFVIGTP